MTVLDPMAGGGAKPVEARLMGRPSRGYDIDPPACLIAWLKTRGVGDAEVIDALFQQIEKVDLSGLALAF